ncbi:MAG: cold shock domain-containing protein [Dokdonella sp.]
MRYQGRITSWKEARGFGFVTPNGGGTEIFLHISSFQRRTKRPLVGDLVTYEVQSGTNARVAATKALFVDLDAAHSRRPSRNAWPMVVALVAAAAVGGVCSTQLSRLSRILDSSSDTAVRGSAQETSQGTDTAALRHAVTGSVDSFQCQGKTHCSQMASCEEATFYLHNCPGTVMDGDNDGIPCEDQLCGH